MKNITLFLLVITCMTFLSLDNSPFFNNHKESFTNTPPQQIGMDTSLAKALIAAYDSTKGVVNIGKYLTKSVYFDFNLLKNAIDTLVNNSSPGTYNINNFGYSLHFAKYDDSNNLIRTYLNAHSINHYAGRNTIVLELKYNQHDVADLTGQKIYLNFGEICPRDCPH